MGNGKYKAKFIAALVALLAGPSLSAAQGPVRINESFVLGDSGCQMNLGLENNVVVSATLGPAFSSPTTATTYSFNFTGTVNNVTGLPTWGPVGQGTPFSGTLTYDPATFTTGDCNPPDATCLVYLPGQSTIASITIIFDFGEFGGIQSFETNIFGYSGVTNNGVGIGPDMYDFHSASISSDPPVAGDVRSVFFLRDDTGSALTSLEYPTNLNFNNWGFTSLSIYVPGETPVLSLWQVTGTLNSLAPAPPTGLIIQSAVQQSSAFCEGSLPIEQLISDTLICEDCVDNGDGSFTCDPLKCQPKTFVERNIMEKSGDGSTYCYYTTTGQRVCKTI